MASLQIVTGSLEGQLFELPPDESFVGRGSSCQIRIGDQGVSAKHAKIWCEAGTWYLMDLGSTNGTFVNDRDIDREVLVDGAEITFGMTRARFVGDAPKPKPVARSSTARPGAAATPARPGTVQRPGTSPGAKVPASDPAGAARAAGPSGLRAEVRTQDEVDLATIKNKAQLLEEENRKLRAQFKQVQEQSVQDAAAAGRADTEKLRALLKQREEELKKLQKELDEKETYYSPAELERERKRMEASIEADRRREAETLQRQVKELEHRVAIRGAESDTVARQLKEKDELIKMLSEREDEVQADLKARDEKAGSLQDELKGLREQASAAAGKEKELNDKVKQKNLQLAQLGKERGDLVQEIAKSRALIAKLGGGDEAAAAVEEQMRATRQMQDTINRLEGEVGKTKDEMSALQGKVLQLEGNNGNLKKQLDEAEASMTDAMDARAKLEGQLSEMLKNSGDRDSHEKQLAMLKADRDARADGEKSAMTRASELESQLSKIRGTYDDIIHERNDLKARVEVLESEMRMSATGAQLSGDWEARYKSAQDEVGDLRAQLAKNKVELHNAVEQASKAPAGTVDERVVRAVEARAEMHEQVVAQMLEQVNGAVSLLRRNAELMRGYIDDCGLLANAFGRIDYTRLEPEEQQMVVELRDQTQPDIIIKNMQGISDENAESIVRAKKILLDYGDAFKKEDAAGSELEPAFNKAQALLLAADPAARITVEVAGALPVIEPSRPETVLFAYAAMSDAKEHPADGKAPSVRIESDGAAITIRIRDVSEKLAERYGGPGDLQTKLVRGFAVDRCGGSVTFHDEEAGSEMVIVLRVKS